MASLFEEALAANSVKGVGKIDLQKHRLAIIFIPLEPLPGSLEPDFSSKWLRDSDLQWPEKFSRWVLVGRAEGLAHQATEAPPHSNRPHVVVFLRKGRTSSSF